MQPLHIHQVKEPDTVHHAAVTDQYEQEFEGLMQDTVLDLPNETTYNNWSKKVVGNDGHRLITQWHLETTGNSFLETKIIAA